VRRRPEESVLYDVVRAELESFLARARERDRTVPRFVERELRAYLGCGILAHGFVRVRCDACGCERLVAFSCKGRGFCPSCGGRRMADTAAHLVDRVLPEVPTLGIRRVGAGICDRRRPASRWRAAARVDPSGRFRRARRRHISHPGAALAPPGGSPGPS
jgi:hypothetical protein